LSIGLEIDAGAARSSPDSSPDRPPFDAIHHAINALAFSIVATVWTPGLRGFWRPPKSRAPVKYPG
jgi:hypothetical protein